jgi:hypothetical protein
MTEMNEQELNKFLSTIRPVTIRNIDKSGKFLAGPDSVITIAPPNANPLIKGLVPEFSEERVRKFMAKPLPESYNLYEDPKYKGKLTPILNQELCGSCWAFSSASVLSDTYVVSKILSISPMISPTSIMNQTLDSDIGNGCGGGYPAKVGPFFQNKENQLFSEFCMDYLWCDLSSTCNGKGEGHLNLSQEQMTQMLNSSIPKPLCVLDDKNKLGYNVEKFETSSDTNLIKAHIMDVGPVVGCYAIYDSFTNNLYHNNNGTTEGVYMETIDPVTKSYNPDMGNLLGYHAVKIVGWGITSDSYDTSGDGNIKRIPYWIVANSWGETWGDRGFFRMAMYPFNKISAFEDPESKLGGFVAFTVSQPSSLLNKYYPPGGKYLPPGLTGLSDKNKQYYSTSDSSANLNVNDSVTAKNKRKRNYFYMIIFIIAIIVLLYYLKKNKYI